QAPGHPWLLGQRGAALPAGALNSGAACRIDPVARDRRAALRPTATRCRAGGCGSDAHSQGARGSMGVRRHTKIIATLGPASSEPATLDALIAAGVDVFRLNFSHGTHDAHATVFRPVRDAAAPPPRTPGVLPAPRRPET